VSPTRLPPSEGLRCRAASDETLSGYKIFDNDGPAEPLLMTQIGHDLRLQMGFRHPTETDSGGALVRM
jgi:hypothetical protein